MLLSLVFFVSCGLCTVVCLFCSYGNVSLFSTCKFDCPPNYHLLVILYFFSPFCKRSIKLFVLFYFVEIEIFVSFIVCKTFYQIFMKLIYSSKMSYTVTLNNDFVYLARLYCPLSIWFCPFSSRKKSFKMQLWLHRLFNWSWL